jgi:hypothetical protein
MSVPFWERLLFGIALVPGTLLTLAVVGVMFFMGVWLLPVALIEFVVCGKCHIEWYFETVVSGFLEKSPMWIWASSIQDRYKNTRENQQ